MKRIIPLGAVTLSMIAIAVANAACARGEPDFSGVWQAYASVGPGAGSAAALTEEGARLVDSFFTELGDNYVEPGAYCVPPGMPSTMTAMVSYPIEIIHSPNRLTMLAELDMQVRRIYTDGREFPEGYVTSRMGYSIGRWQGETLVVETRLLGEYLMREWPRTENTQIVERVYRANRDELEVVRNGFPPESESNDLLVFEMTVTDSTLYKEPQRIAMYYQRIAEDQFLEYDCIAGVWEAALRGEMRPTR
jgi:hypothetical protein